jgi:hypothetical protein
MTEDEIVEAIRALPGLPPPAPAEAVAEAERVIGYRLPPLLCRLYLEVANGGFGPRTGVLGVAGSDYLHHGDWADLVDAYQAFNGDSRHPGLVWLFDWGCLIWSVVDCRDPVGHMWGWDPNFDQDADFSALFPQNTTLQEWLAESLSGNLEKAFETSSLTAIAERRRVPDAFPVGAAFGEIQPLADDEIIAAIGKQGDLPPPASAMAVADAEAVLGFAFPPLLRRLYLEVANGGFGPGEGVLGVPDAGSYKQRTDIVRHHRIFSSGRHQLVPEGMLWLCDWGSAIWSLLDCRDSGDGIWGWDPMGPHLSSGESMRESQTAAAGHALFPVNMTLSEWLTLSINGMFDDPFRPSSLRGIAQRRAQPAAR